MTGGLLITGADLGVDERLDVRADAGLIAEVDRRLWPTTDDTVIDAAGGALLPGLHDHHLHLFALAASLRSVPCGPPAVTDRGALRDVLGEAARVAPPGTWIRAVGYHESVAGALDRWSLDELVHDRPVRLQHRSGGLWIVNSLGTEQLGLATLDEPGNERDDHGMPTGRLWRLDGWLREAVGRSEVDLGAVGRVLARHGITGVTDATPDLAPEALADLAAATDDGRLPQRVHLLGTWAAPSTGGRLSVGPHKLLLPDHDLPSLDWLVERVRTARADGRAVAVHCVTRASLVLTLAALAEAGPLDGDRIEHGSVIPDELIDPIAELGLRVVTQPVFLPDRGDDYLADVAYDDLPHLYRHASLLRAGIPTTVSSDAPFGDVDPWRGLAAARDRRTIAGRVVTPAERVDVAAALRGLLSPLDDPGGPPRRLEPGAPADICLLHVPLANALAAPSTDLVRHTICAGTLLDL